MGRSKEKRFIPPVPDDYVVDRRELQRLQHERMCDPLNQPEVSPFLQRDGDDEPCQVRFPPTASEASIMLRGLRLELGGLAREALLLFDEVRAREEPAPLLDQLNVLDQVFGFAGRLASLRALERIPIPPQPTPEDDIGVLIAFLSGYPLVASKTGVSLLPMDPAETSADFRKRVHLFMLTRDGPMAFDADRWAAEQRSVVCGAVVRSPWSGGAIASLAALSGWDGSWLEERHQAQSLRRRGSRWEKILEMNKVTIQALFDPRIDEALKRLNDFILRTLIDPSPLDSRIHT